MLPNKKARACIAEKSLGDFSSMQAGRLIISGKQTIGEKP
jgi:hypothetical protein